MVCKDIYSFIKKNTSYKKVYFQIKCSERYNSLVVQSEDTNTNFLIIEKIKLFTLAEDQINTRDPQPKHHHELSP